MRSLHRLHPMILQLRSFLAVIEEGSLHRAATPLNLSQSALSRMQALEHELGGKLLECSSTGVRPTAGGHALAAKMESSSRVTIPPCSKSAGSCGARANNYGSATLHRPSRNTSSRPLERFAKFIPEQKSNCSTFFPASKLPPCAGERSTSV